MPKSARRHGGKKSKTGAGVAGTYVYDKKLGRVVQVSDRIPRVSSRAGKGAPEASEDVGPCGRTECGGGSCAGAAGEFD